MSQNYNYLDLTDLKFGRLTCIKDVGRTKGYSVLWLCKCECGNEPVVSSGKLTSFWTQSCGCLQKEKNAIAHTTHSLARCRNGKQPKLYKVWGQMRQRCVNPNSAFYGDYGGRGIKVCEEWERYLIFHQWAMDNGYGEGLTIERKDVDKGYSPDNCCWISRLQQSRNKRNNLRLTFHGKTQLLIDWAEEIGISASTLRLRRKYGWSVERILTQPLRITQRGSKDVGNTITKSVS